MTDYAVEAYLMVTAACPKCSVLLRIAEDRSKLECQNHHCDNNFQYWRPLSVLHPIADDGRVLQDGNDA